jgi:hypothetical protein
MNYLGSSSAGEVDPLETSTVTVLSGPGGVPLYTLPKSSAQNPGDVMVAANPVTGVSEWVDPVTLIPDPLERDVVIINQSLEFKNNEPPVPVDAASIGVNIDTTTTPFTDGVWVDFGGDQVQRSATRTADTVLLQTVDTLHPDWVRGTGSANAIVIWDLAFPGAPPPLTTHFFFGFQAGDGSVATNVVGGSLADFSQPGLYGMLIGLNNTVTSLVDGVPTSTFTTATPWVPGVGIRVFFRLIAGAADNFQLWTTAFQIGGGAQVDVNLTLSHSDNAVTFTPTFGFPSDLNATSVIPLILDWNSSSAFDLAGFQPVSTQIDLVTSASEGLAVEDADDFSKTLLGIGRRGITSARGVRAGDSVRQYTNLTPGGRGYEADYRLHTWTGEHILDSVTGSIMALYGPTAPTSWTPAAQVLMRGRRVLPFEHIRAGQHVRIKAMCSMDATLSAYPNMSFITRLTDAAGVGQSATINTINFVADGVIPSASLEFTWDLDILQVDHAADTITIASHTGAGYGGALESKQAGQYSVNYDIQAPVVLATSPLLNIANGLSFQVDFAWGPAPSAAGSILTLRYLTMDTGFNP